MAKKQLLGFKCALRLDEHFERVQHWKRRPDHAMIPP
jgi:hypothetical protein